MDSLKAIDMMHEYFSSVGIESEKINEQEEGVGTKDKKRRELYREHQAVTNKFIAWYDEVPKELGENSQGKTVLVRGVPLYKGLPDKVIVTIDGKKVELVELDPYKKGYIPILNDFKIRGCSSDIVLDHLEGMLTKLREGWNVKLAKNRAMFF